MSDLRDLARLVLQRVDSVDTVFKSLRNRDFPTEHLRDLVRFPASVCRQIRSETPRLLDKANATTSKTAHEAIERTLKRYGLAIGFVHQSLAFLEGADVPAIPAGFLHYLAEQSALLISNGRFALRGDPTFNYMYLPLDEVVNTALSTEVRSRIPRPFALFHFPSAIRDDALQHCILGHELGHFLDRTKNMAANSWNDAPNTTKSVVIGKIRTEGGTVRAGATVDVIQEYWLQLGRWMSEVVCDLVGCHLLGPAFFYAGREFHSV